MGSNSSKPSTHVWNGSQATGVSHDMVESLQSGSETDASRSQTLELQIQARVAEELKKLRAAEAASLKEAHEKLSEVPSEKQDGLTRFAVSREAAALRTRLEEESGKVRALPDTVENARTDVVRCLRDNDRRPLDCWQEVAKFRDEVRKLEGGWVDKVAS